MLRLIHSLSEGIGILASISYPDGRQTRLVRVLRRQNALASFVALRVVLSVETSGERIAAVSFFGQGALVAETTIVDHCFESTQLLVEFGKRVVLETKT